MIYRDITYSAPITVDVEYTRGKEIVVKRGKDGVGAIPIGAIFLFSFLFFIPRIFRGTQISINCCIFYIYSMQALNFLVKLTNLYSTSFDIL